MRYRVLLSHHVVAVTPLLELSPAASPSAADLASYTLQLEATCSKVGGHALGKLKALVMLGCVVRHNACVLACTFSGLSEGGGLSQLHTAAGGNMQQGGWSWA
jgi:hypothetical protein